MRKSLVTVPRYYGLGTHDNKKIAEKLCKNIARLSKA
jgi:hypothetical protein